MFFTKFDQVTYDPTGGTEGKLATNILNSILVKYHPATNTTQFLYHTIVDGETPEILADRFYRNPEYHWIVLMMNNMVDPFYDWILDTNRFAAMLTERYGVGNEDKPNHFIYLDTLKRLDEVAQLDAEDYFTTNGFYPVNVGPISNRVYEQELNDVKREVKILRPKYLLDFINQFEDLMNRDTLV